MKYIIDLPDNCSWVQWVMTSDKDGHAYFDFKSPEDLTPLDKELEEAYQKGFEVGQHEATTIEYQQGLEEGKKQAKAQAHLDVCHDIERVAHGNYQQGLDDAWECARKIAQQWEEETDTEHRVVIDDSIRITLDSMTASEAIAKLKAYEEQQKADEIKVSDIITDGKINYLVIDITDKSYVALKGTDFEPSYIGKDYIKSYHNLHDSKDMQKIAEEINKAMKGEQQERRCISCEHYNSPIEMRCIHCRNYDKWELKEGED